MPSRAGATAGGAGCGDFGEQAETCMDSNDEGMEKAQDRLTLDLVGFDEIADRWGTTPGTVRSWRNRHRRANARAKQPYFPEPYVVLAIGPIWEWEPVRD